MTVLPNALTVRPITGPEELELFNRLPYVQNPEFADDLAKGRRRPSWMWVALDGDRLLARLSWWCRNHDDAPFLLDVLDVDDSARDVDRVGVAEHLLRTANEALFPEGVPVPQGTPPPEYLRFVPADWREDGAARRTVEDRVHAVERVGAVPLVERLRYEWFAGYPVPRPSGRLRFRGIEGTEDILGLMARALEGTLDAHDRVDLDEKSAEEVAAANFADEFANYTTPRDWWRVATLPDGEPVGFVIPARNAYHPIIAYIAVLPEHRGNGYIDDLLAEGTRVLAEEGVSSVRAATDVGNAPMAEAFTRAGYDTISAVVNMTWTK
ncbi:N-acetyltransferase [Nocardiopsis terrae]|uniref:GNAT superfamily N-acetyltransferase n=1 Tax=Nocardiopsis terrae TaxID=372655 RepID=A0ABR9HCT7_9ACTN|nr:GNAT family N-acetyltransferase [Nocardiopsis terrae]MBE1456834.1 GNAT superfamily N-acetyltransferase [Nocardiopsis terrae]GHC74874.1 N-acetyltransferase [Nocardiopsis terrae]